MDDIWRRISSSGSHKRKVFLISSSDLTSSGTTIVNSALNGKLKTLHSNGRYQCVLYHGSSLQGNSYVYSLFRDTTEEEILQYHELMSKALVPFLTLPTSVLQEEHLNAVCSNIWENPTWSAAHIAVLSNFLEAFQSEEISSHINSLDSENGQTPLHLAVKAGNLKAVKCLLEEGANPFIPDGSGNTPVHHLVSSEKEAKEHHEILVYLTRSRHETYVLFNDIEQAVTPLVLALQVGKIDMARIMVANNFLLDVGDSMGRPIHYAMKMDDLLLLGEILSGDKSQGFARCSKYIGTALHWVKSVDALMLLLKSDVELNARSRTGDTALHIMIKRQRMDCCLQLLIAGADADICDNEGNSPLHTAAMLNNVDMVRALIAFNADVNGCNSQGQSPRHLASTHGEKGSATLQALHLVGAKRCKNQAADCRHGCLPWGRYNGDVWEQPYDVQDECNEVYAPAIKQTIEQLLAIWEENHRNRGKKISVKRDRLLCLDGGGSRGIVEIQVLLAIERASDRRIRDSFDWIAGTSAGAINALLISHGYTMDECRRIFFRFTQDLFKGTKPYSGQKLEKFAKELFGETKLVETEKPNIYQLCILLTGYSLRVV
ncbi:85/88 kDa calcium-independent phospholipase A2 [Holothuria leucospilota]|uniref:phospholipase A2 n=1 Tax=Holothuria leucospilota TaxID=206669 RepID=A0A9Q0YE59_HOLLE|nr:85/88 kDa calcium-independent phospholipase A2 [Holothuria leucospilota]